MKGRFLLKWKCQLCGFVHSKERNTNCPKCGHAVAKFLALEQKETTKTVSV